MKIAQIVCVFPPYRGGIGTVAKQYAEIVSRAGHQSYVITPEYKNREQYSSDMISMIYLRPLLSYGNSAFVPQILRKLRDFDIVHLHYPFYGGAEMIWLTRMLTKKNFRLIIHYHMDVAGLSVLAEVLRLPDKLIRTQVFNMADKISCASLDYIKASNIKKIFEKHEEKFVEIPFSVDNEYFISRENKTEGKLKILFVGGLDRAHHFKGVDVLINALKEIESSDWELTVVGGGNMEHEYMNKVSRLKLDKKIIFAGQTSDQELLRHYQDADLLVFPSTSKNEAFGLVLLEAMACGLPVIASNLRGVRTVFTDKQEGFYIEPNNIEMLAEKIKYIIDNPAARRAMSSQARKLVEKKYTISIMEKNLMLMYENLYNK